MDDLSNEELDALRLAVNDGIQLTSGTARRLIAQARKVRELEAELRAEKWHGDKVKVSFDATLEEVAAQAALLGECRAIAKSLEKHLAAVAESPATMGVGDIELLVKAQEAVVDLLAKLS